MSNTTLERTSVPGEDGDKDLTVGLTLAAIEANGGEPPAEWGLDGQAARNERFGTTEEIYAGLGKVGIAEPRLSDSGRMIRPNSLPHFRRQAQVAERRMLGSLSLGQRRHIR